MATFEPLALPGADVVIAPAWLDPAAAATLFGELQQAIAWETHRIVLFGREVDVPRRSCWIGDPDARYAYSGRRFEPRPWPRALGPVRARLEDELGLAFNSVLANLYRDGRDAMGWHRDNERELGPRPVIASLSLGAPRRFVLKHVHDPTARAAVVLAPGSLLLMRGDTQRLYRHALPRTAAVVGARINLTFRRIEATARAQRGA